MRRVVGVEIFVKCAGGEGGVKGKAVEEVEEEGGVLGDEKIGK